MTQWRPAQSYQSSHQFNQVHCIQSCRCRFSWTRCAALVWRVITSRGRVHVVGLTYLSTWSRDATQDRRDFVHFRWMSKELQARTRMTSFTSFTSILILWLGVRVKCSWACPRSRTIYTRATDHNESVLYVRRCAFQSASNLIFSNSLNLLLNL